jgi:hypothetical protein
MKTLLAVMVTVSLALLGIASSASAFEGGGRKPSEAPLITVGQHYTGQLNNHKNDANYGGYKEVAIWRLPPVTTRDVVTVDWHSVPYTNDNSEFPVCLTLAQGIDDYSWGSVFGSLSSSCYSTGPAYSLSGSGSAQTAITVQETNASSSYIEFFAQAGVEAPSSLETYPYDFTVEPIRHYLGLALGSVQRVSANGTLHASVTLANGLPAPDGLAFTLGVSWAGGGTASYAAAGAGGGISFPLALPETALGKKATFVVSHAADAEYQAATSPKLVVAIAKAKATPTSPCLLAERHALSLTRQYKRLVRHARNARGASRTRLHRRAVHTKRRLHAARIEAQSACGTS